MLFFTHTAKFSFGLVAERRPISRSPWQLKQIKCVLKTVEVGKLTI